MEVVFRVLGILFFVVVILFLSYVTTKYVGTKANKSMKGKYINIIDTVSLGLDKHIYLLKAGESYLLISSTGKSVEFLTTIKMDGTEIENSFEGEENIFDFKTFFEKYLDSFRSKKNFKDSKNVKEENSEILKDEAFKSNLERLRTMTSKIEKKGEKNGDDSTDEH